MSLGQVRGLRVPLSFQLVIDFLYLGVHATQMKLKDYIEDLQKLATKYPELVVVTASDDEGNSYGEVNYSPSVGHFDGNEFDVSSVRKPANAVCLN